MAAAVTVTAGVSCQRAAASGSYQWDANGDQTSAGGGTWSTSAPRWFDGSIDVPWNNDTFNQAVFGGAGTGGLITLNGQINANSVVFNTAGYSLSSGTLTLAAGNLSNPPGTIRVNADATINSTVAGNVGLSKLGGSTITLGASNTYAGGTSITAGRLLASNTTGSATGAGSVTIGGTGALAGTGTVAGAVTISNGGTISSGDGASSTGTLATGAQTWSGGGAYLWQINDANGAEGAADGWDRLSMGSIVSVAADGGTFTIKIVTLGNASSTFTHSRYDFTIARAPSGGTFDATKLVLDTTGVTGLAGGTFSKSVVPDGSGSDLIMSFDSAAATPEPGALGHLAIAAAGLLRRRRKRRDGRRGFGAAR